MVSLQKVALPKRKPVYTQNIRLACKPIHIQRKIQALRDELCECLTNTEQYDRHEGAYRDEDIHFLVTEIARHVNIRNRVQK